MLWFKFDYLMIWLHAFQTWEWVHVLFWAMTKRSILSVCGRIGRNKLFFMLWSRVTTTASIISEPVYAVRRCICMPNWSVLWKCICSSQLVYFIKQNCMVWKQLEWKNKDDYFYVPCYELYFFEFSLQVKGYYIKI